MERYDWENPNVNLDLDNTTIYGKGTSEAIKEAKSQINRFLHSFNSVPVENLSEQDIIQKKIYESILKAIKHYEQIAITPESEFKSKQSFKEFALSEISLEHKYLVEKYKTIYPEYDQPSIEISVRIKSFMSFLNKALTQIDEYWKKMETARVEKEGNNSQNTTKKKNNQNKYDTNAMLNDIDNMLDKLQDLFGIEYVVTPPKSVMINGLEGKFDFLNQFSIYLMEYHNVYNSENPEFSLPHEVKFLKVPQNRINEMNKAKTSPGFDKKRNIWVPFYNPNPEIDLYRRDYVKNPKLSGYQAFHMYGIINEDGNVVEWHIHIPETKEYADKGPACHKNYKSFETSFNRLALPFFYKLDSQTGQFRELNNEERMIETYGINHKDLFNTDFDIFVQLPIDIQNALYSLQGSVEVIVEENTHEKVLVDYTFTNSPLNSVIIESPDLYQERYNNATTQEDIESIKNDLNESARVVDSKKEKDPGPLFIITKYASTPCTAQIGANIQQRDNDEIIYKGELYTRATSDVSPEL